MTRGRGRVTVSRMKWIRCARRLVDRYPFATDAVVAVGLAAFVQQDIWGSSDYFTASKAVYVPAALLMTLPLAFRRRAPFAVAVVVMGALVAEALAVGTAPTPDSQLVGWLLAIYTVAALCDRTAAVLGGALSLAAGLVWMGFDDFLFPLVVFGGAWVAGRLVRERQVHAAAVEERAAALEREVEANLRAAAAEERARIARELHDLLSHSVSVMVVQAAAERSALNTERAAPAEALESIERTGRQALTEMRRLFSLLRSDAPAELAPQPTLAELDVLVAQVREAGLPVELQIDGAPDRVPPEVALSAYRIIQEALTNVVKHAGPARACVVVRYSGDAVEVEVVDSGRGASDHPTDGHGLAGMRERVALFGGEFDAGQRTGGGFAVRARLPHVAASA
jgi:signal transduction histidine kinase